MLSCIRFNAHLVFDARYCEGLTEHETLIESMDFHADVTAAQVYRDNTGLYVLSHVIFGKHPINTGLQRLSVHFFSPFLLVFSLLSTCYAAEMVCSTNQLTSEASYSHSVNV